MNHPIRIEALESRIAPAAIVTFTEVDGDHITVKTNLGSTAQLEEALGITSGSTAIDGFTVGFINTDALASAFAGTNLSIKASGGGNNLADLVKINAFDGGSRGIDLGKVKVKGNIVYLDAGDEMGGVALKSLKATSFILAKGVASATTSEIHGDIGSIKIKDSFDGYIVSEDATGKANFETDAGTQIGSFSVRRTLGVESGNDSGHLQVGSIGRLTIDTMLGSPGFTDAGLIEAQSIANIDINEIRLGARIVLSDGA